MRQLLLTLLLVLSFNGYAHAGTIGSGTGINVICAHIYGNELTIPYVGGKGNADVYFCHAGCVGFFTKCSEISSKDMADLTATYLKTVQADGKLTTTGPGTVSFTPAK